MLPRFRPTMRKSTVIAVWALGNFIALAAIMGLGHGSGAWILLLPLTAWPALLSPDSYGPIEEGERRPAIEARLGWERLCLTLCALPWIEIGGIKVLRAWGFFPEIGRDLPRGSLPQRAIWMGFLALGGSALYAIITQFRSRILGLEATRDFYRAQVREVDRRNQAIIGALPDRLFLLGAKGTVLDMHFRGVDDLFPEHARLLGRRLVDAHPASQELSERLQARIDEAFATKSVQPLEYRCKTASGERRFEAQLVPSGPEEVLMISRDVTREWQQKRELEVQRAQMITSSRLSLLGEMAGGVAHEINNPLAIIQGHACLIQENAGAGHGDSAGRDGLPGTASDSAPAHRSMSLVASARKIEQSVERISRIVQSLRVFAREPSDDPAANVRVSALLAAPLELFRERARNHGISLIVGRVPETLEVHCQPAQISQVILNLMSNAYDSVQDRRESGGWVELSVRNCEHDVEIAVADSGRGVPMELRDRVFEPFFTTKEPGRGTGLGLSFCLGVAVSHGGSLLLAEPPANKRDGRSSRFVLRIPKRSIASSTVARPADSGCVAEQAEGTVPGLAGAVEGGPGPAQTG